MILNIYSIHDRKAQIYNRPFYEQNEIVAVRNVERAFMDSESTFCAYPNDFELVKLGTYDDISGSFDILDIPVLVDFRRVKKEV